MQPEIQPHFKHRVDLYLDNELPQHEQEQLLAEVSNNPHYQEVIDQERSFRDFLRNSVSRRTVAPGLIDNIREKLRQPPV
jgi:hypothetical protein